MTCPNWRRLSDRRELQPEAWDHALEHLDECARCYDDALAVEPTLLFRQLPAPAVGNDEVAAMRQAVATLRRSSQDAPRPRAAWLTGLRAAALAAVLVGAALLQGAAPEGTDPSASVPAARGDAVAVESAAAEISDPFDRMPLVEDLDPAYGSAVQVVDDQLSLVLVLPPRDVERSRNDNV